MIIKTVELDDSVEMIKFTDAFVWVRNLSDSDIIATNPSGDTVSIPSGHSARYDRDCFADGFFLIGGTGTAELYFTNVPECPFRIAGSAGGGGGGSAVLGTKTVTENGVYYASADGFDGFSRVTVNTPVKTLGEKYITKNGVYNASGDSLDGYDKVTVDVPCIIIGTASEVTL